MPNINGTTKMSKEKLRCPECDSSKVTVTAEQMFMANTNEHYCHSVKTQDDNARATCLKCRWIGERRDLKFKTKGAENDGRETT